MPHQDNISYFGNIDRETGVGDEAHMVYQFPLAPLVLHTLITGNSDQINQWVESLEDTGIFMNFIASHDGIGMMPAVGLISDEDIERGSLLRSNLIKDWFHINQTLTALKPYMS